MDRLENNVQERGAVGLAERRELCAAEVTLNGEPAIISGALMDFARVTNPRTHESYQWAWGSVRRVVANGGQFKR